MCWSINGPICRFDCYDHTPPRYALVPLLRHDFSNHAECSIPTDAANLQANSWTSSGFDSKLPEEPELTGEVGSGEEIGSHVSFAVENYDKFVDALKEKGIRFLEFSIGERRQGFFSDPDGRDYLALWSNNLNSLWLAHPPFRVHHNASETMELKWDNDDASDSKESKKTHLPRDDDSSHGPSFEMTSHSLGTVVAPMAGLVVKVLEKDGMTVAEGQPVLVLEAMKIEVQMIYLSPCF
ncbi:hypothetical protein Syun_029338 [Stephania yunnanensis]|uniref:Lipoyl-binding domain-containing protein n=1 Tax=Stephania yunnanensis TaxID=152371 RepID=A0AAP0E5E1_9MAGN